MPAPKGNTFALGNSGKPKKWKTPSDLQDSIDAYFEWCKNNPMKSVHKSQIDPSTKKPLVFEEERPYTIEGLCIFLDCERETLLNYQRAEGYEEFFSIIKKAKLRIQQDKVERGISGNGTASVLIFDLKNNHGYKDKQETQLSGEVNIKPKQWME